MAKKFPNFFGGYLLKDFGYHRYGETAITFFFTGSFFDHAVQQVNLFIFRQALINIVQQTRLTFDLEIETTHGHCSSLRVHMSVGDSAEEFISIHALGRERLPGLSCGLPSHPLKIVFFARWETIETFCLSFLHTSRQYVFLTEA